MSTKNFKVKNGLSINNLDVIDGTGNATFNILTANSVVVSGGLQSEDSFARNTANTAVNNAASASQYANTGITLAQAAFNQANTAGGADQYARDTANSAGIYANTGINNAASASAYANTGINNAASASVYANTGITLAQASFNQGNSTATVANTAINNAASASQYANTAINNSASASSYANAGITLAQAAYNQGNSTAIIANTKFDSAGGTITGNVTISGNNNLVVTGNLFVQGNTVTTNTQSFVVADPVILLASGNFYTDAKDIGFAAHYNDGTNAHTGFIRDYVTKEYYIFDNYTPELDANNEININDASFREANVHAGFFKGNVIGTTVVSNGVDLGTHIQSAFNQANTGVNNAASASLYANAGITLAQAAYNQGNSTATVANTGVTIAQAAYNQANTVQTFAVGGLFTGASFATGKSNSITFGSPSGAFSDYLGTLTGGSLLAMRLTNTSSGKIYNGYFTLSFAPAGGFVTVSSWTPFLSGGNNPITDGASFSDTTTAEVYTDIYLARNSRVSDSITLAQAAYNAQNSTAIVANAAVTATSTTTLTNKRITLRTANNGATLSGNLTPDSDTTDQYNIIGITGTTNIQIPSGTPTEGQKLVIRIKDGGVAQTLTWITTAGGYRVIGTTLPTTTTASKVNYVGCVYNSQDSYWDVVAVSTQS